jgi:hypothetical protein
MAHVDGSEPLDKLREFQFDPPYYEESQLMLMKLPVSVVVEPGPDVVIKLSFGRDYVLRFETPPGFEYQVQSSSDLDDWSDLGDTFIDDGSGMRAVSVTPADESSTFYRIIGTSVDT